MAVGAAYKKRVVPLLGPPVDVFWKRVLRYAQDGCGALRGIRITWASGVPTWAGRWLMAHTHTHTAGGHGNKTALGAQPPSVPRYPRYYLRARRLAQEDDVLFPAEDPPGLAGAFACKIDDEVCTMPRTMPPNPAGPVGDHCGIGQSARSMRPKRAWGHVMHRGMSAPHSVPSILSQL